ncbi:MAG TPA: peptidase, partial [Saprospiraceae bacterium]|nr:peptidase [Saprospiraceae bacterium]
MKKLIVLLLICFSFTAFAQKHLPQSVNFRKSVENQFRQAQSGLPGSEYWINKADYKMNILLEPFSGRLSGSEDITYYNNSPDTLKDMVMALYQNFYKKGLCADYNTPPERQTDGVQVQSISVNGTLLSKEKAKQVRTNLFLTLDQPILPHSTAKLHVEWSYLAREGNTVRTGNYGDGRHFTGYFYPKIAVYDDMDGWDRTDYLGIAEFYSDFNDYDVHVTLPKDFVVWATGLLQNPDEVLRPKFAQRLAKAKKSNKVIKIIDSTDVKNGNITLQKEHLTWHYTAQNAPDFAFATDKDHLWDGWSVTVDPHTGRKAFVDASYEKESADYYQVARIAGQALMDYSTDFPGVPYPFPAMTVFNAPSGMEFPMMVNDATEPNIASTMGLTYHEIGHTYFPFYMGINERKYAWMDEGWATFLPGKYFKNYDPNYDFHGSRVGRYLQIAGTEAEVPIITLSKDQHRRLIYRNSSYNKPYLAYYFLQQYVGEDVFRKMIQGYIKNWHGKHPTPYDFFNAFNTLAGKNLNWYWKNWFFEKNYADVKIANVADQGIYL